LFLINTN